jgi:glycosidase
MVEAFVDGDPGADFNFGYGTSAHKGDLQGIINSLDYIKSLGVNAIWLTPIFKSIPLPSQDIAQNRLDATGYFASDYFAVDPKFGSLAQAQTLVNEAHKRGLYVLFDGVFGHHKGNVVASPNGLKPAGGSNPVDYSQPDTLNFYKEVATFWIRTLKIDGWRLDQAYQVPPSAWTSLRAEVELASASVSYLNSQGFNVSPLGYMVAEIWDGESRIASAGYGTNSTPILPSAFDFPTRYKLVQTLASEESGYANRTGSNLNSAFSGYSSYPDHAVPNLMLGNHDLVRFGDLIQRAGLGNPDGVEYWSRHKAAFSFLAAHSGPLTIYYGDEIGQEVPGYAAKVISGCADLGLCDDHVSRSQALIDGVAGVSLNASQSDLKNYVAKLMQVRAANAALAVGVRTHIFSNESLFVDRKDAGTNRVLYLLNTKNAATTVTLSSLVLGVTTELSDLITGEIVTVNGSSQYIITLPGLTGRLLKF